MSYGIDTLGFQRPQYQEIFDAIVSDIEATQGKIRSDAASVFGNLISVFSKKIVDVWELANLVYDSHTITAEGVALDDVVQWSGLTRIPASYSGVYIVMYGIDGTVIPVNTIVANTITNIQFELDSTIDLEIVDTNVGACKITVSYVSGFTYIITTTGATFTYVDSTGNNAELVALRLIEIINLDTSAGNLYEAYTVVAGTIYLKLKDFSNAGGSVSVSANLTINEFGTAVPFVAQNPGPVISNPGELTTLVTAIVDCSRVYNFEYATPGKNTETDSELRTRFFIVRSAVSRSTVEAIYNAVISVPGVIAAQVYVNYTTNSFSVVVDCPSTIEQAVADAIFASAPAAVPMTGTSSKVVSDSLGNNYTIYYSKVVFKYIHVRVILTKSIEIAFPIGGEGTIAQNILAAGDLLGLGANVLYQQYFGSVFAVPGIESATVEIAKTNAPGDSPSYAAANIAISQSERALFDISRIHVS